MVPTSNEQQQQLTDQDAKDNAALSAQGYTSTKALVKADLVNKVALPKVKPTRPRTPMPETDVDDSPRQTTLQHPHDSNQVQVTAIFTQAPPTP
jgi:hypothetical protein